MSLLKVDLQKNNSQNTLSAPVASSHLGHSHTQSKQLAKEWQDAEAFFQSQGVQHTLAVFGSARIPVLTAKNNQSCHPLSHFNAEAEQLSFLIGQYIEAHLPHTRLITGGGPGIMEAANRGAHQAQHASMGLNIKIPREQQLNPFIQPQDSFEFQFFAARKAHFFKRNRALIVFPGGFGTLDELFEALTLIQTGKTPAFPILLFGKEFWQALINLPILKDYQLIDLENINLVEYVDTAQEAFELLQPTLEKLQNSPMSNDRTHAP